MNCKFSITASRLSMMLHLAGIIVHRPIFHNIYCEGLGALYFLIMYFHLSASLKQAVP